MERIYLDHAATTPIDPKVRKAMHDFEAKFFGNPNSVHREGQQARAEIDMARANIGKFLNAKPQEIIFTSGATEANNHAIKGAVSSAIFDLGIKPHVVCTSLEHQTAYNAVADMEKKGVIEATYVNPDANGVISVDDMVKAIKENTVLVCMMLVSNEIGTILPVRELSRALDDINSKQTHKILFHTDAAQAAKYFNCNVEKIGCDLMTVSAQKLYGPKGIGCLYIKTGVKIDNLLSGGAQEYGKRPGTQNTVGIIGMSAALEQLGTLEERQHSGEKIKKLRDQLLEFMQNTDGVEINGPIGELRSPENLNITVYDVDQDSLIASLDLAGMATSTGSACISGSSEPSHVIKSLGKITDRPAAFVRFTLGKDNTQKEIDYIIKTFPEILKNLKK